MGGDSESWSFTGARQPARFAAARPAASPGLEHAVRGGRTLCGIPAAQHEVFRHLFETARSDACPDCAAAAASAPTVPSGQERLHGLVEACPSSELRDGLLAALGHGADIEIWIDGPAKKVSVHAQLSEVTTNRDEVEAALAGSKRTGIVRVRFGDERYLVVLAGGRPVLARLADAV